jgi:hypothetical protein
VIARAAIAVAALLVLGGPAGATDLLASCGAVKGRAYYPSVAGAPQPGAGWVDDGISAGSTTLVRRNDGELDLLFTDAMRQPVSAREDGAEVVLMWNTGNEAAVLVAYPKVAEIYQFIRKPNGSLEVMHLQAKSTRFSKGALMVGQCSALPILGRR